MQNCFSRTRRINSDFLQIDSDSRDFSDTWLQNLQHRYRWAMGLVFFTTKGNRQQAVVVGVFFSEIKSFVVFVPCFVVFVVLLLYVTKTTKLVRKTRQKFSKTLYHVVIYLL